MGERRGQYIDRAGADRIPEPTPEPTPEPAPDEPVTLTSTGGFIRHAAAQLAVEYYKHQGTPKAIGMNTLKDAAVMSGECVVILAQKIEEYLRGDR
jgi:hypothetical protein